MLKQYLSINILYMITICHFFIGKKYSISLLCTLLPQSVFLQAPSKETNTCNNTVIVCMTCKSVFQAQY